MTIGPFRRDDRTPPRTDGRSDGEAASKAADERAAAAMREHLAEIGAVLDLPTKRPTRATGHAAIPAVPSTADHRALRRWISGAIVAIGAAVAVTASWPTPSPEVPAALLGEWSTSDPDYAGKRLIFWPDTIEIGVSESAIPHRFRIIALVSKTSTDTIKFNLTYEDDGGPVSLQATLVESAPARLVMDRPTGLIWERRLRSP